MSYLYFFGAIIALVIANVFKVLRQAQFIDPYDNPKNNVLVKGLAIGNFINFFVPLRLGNLYRAYYDGKRMKYGVSFSLATIIVEIILDFIFVSFVYIIFSLLGKESFQTLLFYLVLLLIVLIGCIVLKKLRRQVKTIIYKFATLFNRSIELKILKTSWFTILSFENIITKVNKFKLILYSVLNWAMNILSCYLLCQSLNYFSNTYDAFNFFFSNVGITSSIIVQTISLPKAAIIGILLYFSISTILLFLCSYILKKQKVKKSKHDKLLLHVNQDDRLQFLELYFNSSDDSNYFKNYLKLNNDVAIIADYSAGSNATTMLCSKDGQTFWRKYSLNKDAKKLKEQIDWIRQHEDKLTLTSIISETYDDGVCSYDMPYIPDAVTCFNYVHTMPFDASWSTLKEALDDINKLHKLQKRKADKATIMKYIDEKVLKNIDKIEQGEFIKPLLKYKKIYINGKEYNNLEYFKKYLNYDYLYNIFKNDEYADIHGDFTIENIICLKNGQNNGKNFYIIDPNTGNIHNSPYLDYAKLFQSVHGGYEFLMNTKNVSYHDDTIDFLFTKSSIYYQLFDKLVIYLKDKFGEEGLKSIFYHEIIHWLRLMPYKIEKNGERSLLFYARMLMLMADVEERFKDETSNF